MNRSHVCVGAAHQNNSPPQTPQDYLMQFSLRREQGERAARTQRAYEVIFLRGKMEAPDWRSD